MIASPHPLPLLKTWKGGQNRLLAEAGTHHTSAYGRQTRYKKK